MSHSSLNDAHRRLQACLSPRPGFEKEDDPSTIWAMPIVLNIPKHDPPTRQVLLEDAARAVLACCLLPNDDFRSSLNTWYGARIRKITRRARNSHWQRVQSVPGVTVGYARACVPSAVVDTHPVVQKLQISGTDIAALGVQRPTERPCVLLNAGLGMTVGKAAAQAGHAAMLLAAHMSESQMSGWCDQGFPLQVCEVNSVEFQIHTKSPEAVLVCDAGFTEVTPGTVTAIALC
ncbi:peptidyl-tRNA hydrolase [Corynebacterium freiburgense]|uniref:peptidyl-tRNA hydrolase n=1 Tax=Corynebacterium freiburgense TaxID=556548 RepID=UPI000404930C|nr:peptidyl-tRNA hydrolase [Corynebacterium freiburgense]